MVKIPNFNQFINESAKYSSDRNHSMFAMHSLSLRDQIHVWHWQTEIGDKHKALGEFYDFLVDKMDEIMEISMGIYGRISVKSVGTPKPLLDIQGINIDEVLKGYADLYEQFRIDTYSKNSDIQNKIDELIGEINKLRYLMTMS
jgi:hypothetical protein